MKAKNNHPKYKPGDILFDGFSHDEGKMISYENGFFKVEVVNKNGTYICYWREDIVGLKRKGVAQ